MRRTVRELYTQYINTHHPYGVQLSNGNWLEVWFSTEAQARTWMLNTRTGGTIKPLPTEQPKNWGY